MRQLCPITNDEEVDDEFIEDASEAADEDDWGIEGGVKISEADPQKHGCRC